MKRIFYTLFLAFFSVANSFAVAPLPGSGLQEPHRGRAPFTILSHDATKNIQKVAQYKTPAINLAPRGLLLLVNFSDVKFSPTNSLQAFDSLANSTSYTYNGATGSCKQYFTDQSNGKYSPNFDVIGPVSLPQTMAYYGANKADGNDQYVVDFVIDACKGADRLGVDFSQYDNNNDGMVDFVYIIYAGYGEADYGGENTIWPHNWDLISALYYGYTNQKEYFATSETTYKLPEIDGKLINIYACSNEMRKANNARSGIGTICHEFSHVLGLPDYYLTTDYSTVLERETPGAWSLMGYGNYLNNGNTPPNYSVYDKYYLGWIEPEALAKTQGLEIPADGATTYMLARNEKHVAEGAYRTDTVYYIENRQQERWDEYLPGHGMLIWRVIFDEEDWYQNCPNDFVARYRLISAEKNSSPYTDDKPKPEVPFPGKSKVTSFEAFSHSGLENIQEINGLITCDFVTTRETPVENIIVSPQNGIWYNILGQPIDPKTYKGIAIHNNKKYLLR
mgnify:FL=1